MSTVGLTKAMRDALEHRRKGTWFVVSKATQQRAEQAGFIEARMLGNEGLSPRGHAALAAPRMTQAEYDGLKWLSTYIVRYAIGHRLRMVRRLSSRGFANFDPFTGDASINDAGRTALNNVRAAMGKEGL